MARSTTRSNVLSEQDGAPEPDLARALDLVMELMAIPGKSGEESRVAKFINQRLRAAGAPASAVCSDNVHRRSPLPGDTGNLLLRLPGTFRGPRRLLSAHMDTVPLCVGSRPVLRKNNLVHSADPATGLGADNRAGAAVLLGAALEILARKLPHPPLTFCWFVQEEVGLQGARLISKTSLGRPRLAFNWDGGSPLKLTIGATGGYRMAVTVHGTASHAGGAPELGVSAIAIASLAIADLQRSGWHGDIRKGRHQGTSNVGLIHGGEATNVVTDHVVVKAEARSHDPQFRKRIVREIEKSFRNAAREVVSAEGKRGKIEFDGQLDYDSFLLDADDPSVLAAEAAVQAIGEQPERAVTNGGLDANWLFRHGIPAVTLGCGQRNQHTVDETLDLNQFRDACRIALRLATATES